MRAGYANIMPTAYQLGDEEVAELEQTARALDPKVGDFATADVLIDGDRIVAVDGQTTGDFDAVRAVGVTIEFVNPIQLDAGSWVETTGSMFFHERHVVVPGLLGRVMRACNGEGVSTDISTSVHLEGREGPDDYFNVLLQPREIPPTPQEIEKARTRASQALEIFHATNGWTGILKLRRGESITERQARRELRQLITMICGNQPLAAGKRKGMWRRSRRLIRAFAEQAKLAEAQELLDRSDEITGSALPTAFCTAVVAFCDNDELVAESHREMVAQRYWYIR